MPNSDGNFENVNQPDAALALAVELHAFMEMDPSLRSGPQVTETWFQPLHHNH